MPAVFAIHPCFDLEESRVVQPIFLGGPSMFPVVQNTPLTEEAKMNTSDAEIRSAGICVEIVAYSEDKCILHRSRKWSSIILLWLWSIA